MIVFVWRKIKDDRGVAPIVRGYVNGLSAYSVMRRIDGSCVTLARHDINSLAFMDAVDPTQEEAKTRAVDNCRELVRVHFEDTLRRQLG